MRGEEVCSPIHLGQVPLASQTSEESPCTQNLVLMRSMGGKTAMDELCDGNGPPCQLLGDEAREGRGCREVEVRKKVASRR